MKVLNFGSLNIDYVYKMDHIVKEGETLNSESVNTFPGGKGLNQSVALCKAGMDTYHAGAVGGDGNFLCEILKSNGVNIDNVYNLEDQRTGHAIIQNDKDGENCIILYGGTNRLITAEMIEEVFDKFDKGDALVLQNEVNNMPLIMETAHKKGMTIILNPSPVDDNLSSFPLEYVDIFLLNEIEGNTILGTSYEDGDSIIKGLKEKYPKAKILLTLGSDGSVYSDDNETVHQGICKVKTIDTTAAGDTYTGFFLAGLFGGKSVKESMLQAAKASAIAVSRAGASVSIPTMEEVDNFSE